MNIFRVLWFPGDGLTILERVNDRRKRRHEAAIEELRQELAAISSHIEPQVESTCNALNSALDADLQQIERELEPIEPPPGFVPVPRPPPPPQPVAPPPPPPPVAPVENKALAKHAKKSLAIAHATAGIAGKGGAGEKQAASTNTVSAAPVSSAPASDSGGEETFEEPPPASEQLQAMSYKELDDLWNRIKSHSPKRRALIDELDKSLSAIEQRRVEMVWEAHVNTNTDTALILVSACMMHD